MKYLFTVAFILCSLLVPAKAQQPNIVFFNLQLIFAMLEHHLVNGIVQIKD